MCRTSGAWDFLYDHFPALTSGAKLWRAYGADTAYGIQSSVTQATIIS